MSGNLQMEVRGTESWMFALKRLQSETRRNAIDAVTYAGVKIAMSGRKIAKPGDKRRAVEKNPDFRRMVRERRKWAKQFGIGVSQLGGEQIYPHYILAYQQRRQDPSKIGTFRPQNDPRREIVNYGLARKMWNILYGQLASLKGTANTALENGAAAIHRSIQGNVTRYTVTLKMAVRLNYLDAAYPGIGASALRNGQASLVNELNKRQELAIARANRKAA